MTIRIILIYCFLSILFACKEKKNAYVPKIYKSVDFEKIGLEALKHLSVSQNGNAKLVNIECESIDEQFRLSDLIDSIWYLPLQTTEKSIVGEVTKVIPIQDKYLIFDRDKAKAIFLFDKEGSLIRRIGKQGKGPHEYLDITDVVVDNNYITYYDRLKGKLTTFNVDGGFVREVSTYASFRNFDILGDGNLIFDVYKDYNVHFPEILNTKILMCDSNFNLLSTALSYDVDAVKEYRYFPLRGNLIPSEDKGVLFSSPLTDTIYSIKDANSIEPQYILDLNDCEVSTEFKQKMKLENFTTALISSEYSYFLGEMVDTEDYLFLCTYKDRKRNSVYFSKTTSKVKGGGTYIDDHPNSIGFNYPISKKGKIFVSYLDAMGIAETISRYGNEEGYINSKNADIISLGQTIESGDNPILLFFTLKDF